jgi:hypothetical protein
MYQCVYGKIGELCAAIIKVIKNQTALSGGTVSVFAAVQCIENIKMSMKILFDRAGKIGILVKI